MALRHDQPTPAETAGRPTRRLGPRPIALHLAAATTGLLSSLGALPSARIGSLPWHPRLAPAAANLTADLARADLEPLTQALGAEVERRLRRMIAGITAYRDHPYRRRLATPPAVWRDGESRLLDYRPDAAADDRPVLLVPSLVNRYYVLDLTPERSLARWLGERGFRPLVVDWGDPSAVERRYTLTDYILGRLGGALDRACELAGGPVAVVGYCMGGNLVAALALHRAADVAALALLATPWDFHAEQAAAARLFAHAGPAWQTLLDALGELPIDLLQTFFAMLDPNLAARKFAAFADLDPASPAARNFVALEDWLNDGVPLAAPVARACLIGWYGENTTLHKRWRVGVVPVDPAKITMPTLLAIPRSDRIVPPASAAALAREIPAATVIRPPSGHIGMMVGSQAPAGLWQPLAEWLRANAGR